MNAYDIENSLFNGGKFTTLWSVLDTSHFNIQLGEIFKDEDYKEGLYKKDMVILDVGANMGLSALYFKDHAKIIYALEPSSQHYEALVHNTKEYPNIKPFNLAMTAKTGQDVLVANEGDPAPESFFGEGTLKEVVNTITFADFFKQQGITHVDLMKIDVEGAEYIILPSRGFRDVVDKIDVIIGEAHMIHDMYPEFIPEILKAYGFEVEWLPKKNMFKTLTIKDIASGEEFNYKISYKTLFIAKRKKK